MPTNLIQIKRSTSATEPPTLSPGELAYSQASNTFWIGAPTNSPGVTQFNIRVGGVMNPGTLTANQALVANSTSGIDRVVANTVEISRLRANNSYGNPGYVLTSAGSTSAAYWQAVSSIGVNPDAQYTWTNTHVFTNTISFTKDVGVSIQAYVINATSYNIANGGGGGGSGGVTISADIISIGNGSINANITANSTAMMFTGTAWNSDKFGGLLPASYVNTTSLTANLANYATATSVTANASAAYANSVAYTNTVWSTVNGAISSAAATAYGNSVAYTNTVWSTVNTAITANAATAYSNALSRVAALYVNTQSFAANLVNYALLTGALFTGSVNAVSYTSGIYGTPAGGVTVNAVAVSVGNTSVNGAISTNATVAYFTGTAYNANNANNAAYLGGQPAANFANTLYVDNAVYGATGGSASQTYVNEKAANAYSNAVAYTDSKISTANAAITGNAATAYANAVTYADTKAATAFSNAVANAANYADSKYATAVGFTVAQADAAYANAMSNTLTRVASYSGNTSFTANVTFTSNTYFSGRAINAGDTDLYIRDVSVSGNLTVLGTLTTIDTENIRIEDASLHLASNQASSATYRDEYDISVFGTFGHTSNTWFTGLYRDHTDSMTHYTRNVWRLYAANNVNILSTNSQVVDKSSIFWNKGTLTAYLEPYDAGGRFVANSSTVSITANGTVSVNISANTISLDTALSPSNGGTGLKLYNTGDIIYASSSTTFAKRTIGSVGKVLQVSSSNLPEWDSLDGGTF